MKKFRSVNIILFSLAFLTGCASKYISSSSHIKKEIQTQLDRCVRAIETKNVDLYMELIPEDFIIYDQSGEKISRDKQREYTLRDWSIIERTLSNNYTADSIKVRKDSTIVYTSQRWERLMYRPDGKTTDTVVTTQKHIETWRKTGKGWLNYDVKELGGQIFINGVELKH